MDQVTKARLEDPCLRLTMVRALSLKPSGVAVSVPEPNFALHLQAGGSTPIQVTEEAAISSRDSGNFPTSIWPAVEELCQRLHGAELAPDGAGDRLRELAEAVAQSLEAEPEQEALGTSLRLTLTHGPLSALRRVLGRLGTRAYRRRFRREEALRRTLVAFDNALQKLNHAALGGVGHSADIERLYAGWLNRTDQSCCFPEPPLPHFNGQPANLYADAAFLRNHPRDATKGHLLEREALAHGLSVLRFPYGSFIAADPHGKQISFRWSRSAVSSGVSLALCTHKEATRIKLRRSGLPVARGRVFSTIDSDHVAAYAARIGYPVVCKPVAGRRGMGVVAGIQNEDELRKALNLFRDSPYGADDFIIEQHVNGSDYRIVVVGEEVVTAVCRENASIVGTGVHTVADLLLFKNRLRVQNPHLRKVPIHFDSAAEYQLERAGLSLNSIPEQGRRVQLANSNNISRGGDSVEVLDELHPSICKTAIRAAQAIPGLGFVGLDILLEDHTKPIGEQQAAIIELNAHGAIGTGQYPMWGPPRNVARHFLLYCAEREGLEVKEPADFLSVKLLIRGRVTGVGYHRWFRRKTKEWGLKGWVANVDKTAIEAELEGETAAVAALVNASVRGPAVAVPYWVSVEHVPPRNLTGFEVRL